MTAATAAATARAGILRLIAKQDGRKRTLTRSRPEQAIIAIRASGVSGSFRHTAMHGSAQDYIIPEGRCTTGMCERIRTC